MSETYRCWSTRPLEALALDPSPQRVHDSEPEHPDTCYCSECWGKRSPIPFDPWHKDVYELARLLRWLELVDELPRDIPLFMETALSWSAQYDLMNEATGR